MVDDRRRNLVRREAFDALVLALIGGAGIVAGVMAFAPTKLAALEPPKIKAPAAGWPAVPEHADEIVRYELKAKLDPDAHTIDGSGTMSIRNNSNAPLDHVRLHLYLNAFKNDATIFRRARVGGFRGDHKGMPGLIDVKRLVVDDEDLWPKHEFVSHKGESPQDPLGKDSPPPMADLPDDETDVRVPLTKPLAIGETLKLTVEFRDELPEVSERTGYQGRFHFAGQWFPKFARLEPDGTWASFPFHHVAEFYADYGHYDVTIDVPEAYTIGASGPLVSSAIDKGRRIERHVLDDVHDFAFTAWDRYVVRTDKEGAVAIRHLAPPGYDAPAEREIESAKHGLRDYGARFGAYPYPVLTIVHPPEGAEEAGGMEYPTLITTGGPWYPAHGAHEVEGVTIHELGHQWFYGLVGTHEVEWPSGDEGFNTFGEELAMERLFGAGSAIATRAFSLSYTAFTRRGIAMSFDEPIFQPAYKFASGRSYGGRVYGATGVVLHTLRNVYGAATFDAAMGVYTRRYRFQHPTPADFFAVLDAEVNKDCGAAARVALGTAMFYDVYVDSIMSEKRFGPAGWFDLAGGRQKKMPNEKQDGFVNAVWIGRRGAVDLPVDVELRFADGSKRREVLRFGPQPTMSSTEGTSWRRIDADGPVALTAAIVDPDFKLLIDRSRLDNFATTSGNGGGVAVTRERALAWIGVLLRSVGP